MLSLARQSLARSSVGRPGSLLFDVELDGFESVLHEDRATFERLQALLRGLRPSGNAYAERLAADAAAAAAEAIAASDAAAAAAAAAQQTPIVAALATLDAAVDSAPLSQSPSPTAQQAGAAAVSSELCDFLARLVARGHDAWLRTGRPAAPTDDPDSSSGADEPGGGAYSGSLSSLTARRASSSGGGTGSGALLAPPAHTFVVARAPGPDETLFIVDASFRDLFSASTVAAAADPVYGALVEALPAVVVGTAGGVASLVAFCCQQMERAFAASGSSLPPWRDAAVMLAIHFPPAADDMQLSDLLQANKGGLVPQAPQALPRMPLSATARGAAAAAAATKLASIASL